MIRQPTTLSSTTTVQLAHRLLIRRDHPTWPFFWRGLGPAVGLLAVIWYAIWPLRTDTIEHTVRQEVRAELDARQMFWAKADVDGQEVRLSGRAPSDSAAKAALKAAAEAKCRTWLVAVRCVTVVHDQFAKGPVTAAAEPEPAIRLTPDAATPSGVITPGRGTGSPLRTDAAGAGSERGGERGAERSAGVAIVASGAASTPLSEPTTTRGCEARIATLLAGASIQFTSGEATIDAGSDPLLDRISQAIRACPGTVRIEGHSDASGRGSSNEALSEARAKAVREVMVQLGLPEDKVIAMGMGSSRPVAPNDTPEGRALNRRIEFHAVEPNR